MTEYLDLDDLLVIARAAIGEDVVVRDYGLLESALARPRASVFGQDAYSDLHLKATALLHSLARNHALIDGNKRLARTPCRTCSAINDYWISARKTPDSTASSGSQPARSLSSTTSPSNC